MQTTVLPSGKCDCAIAPQVEGPKIVNVPLEKQRMGIVMHKDHPLAARNSLLFTDVANELFAAYPSSTVPREFFERFCRGAGFDSTRSRFQA